MPNNLDSVIANEALQQTSAPSCSPRLFICFSVPLQLPTKRIVINIVYLFKLKYHAHFLSLTYSASARFGGLSLLAP